MCNPFRCCFGKKRRKKQKMAVADGAVETSQITMNPEDRSDRIAKNLSNPDKLETADVTEIFKIPSKEFATVDELIAAQGYQIGNEIGRRQFGVVYQTKRMRDAVPMACKVIEPQKMDTRTSAKNELFVLQRLSERGLQHPHIVRLYGHFVVDSPKVRQVYILMQLAFGKSLSELTKRYHNGQPKEVCKRISVQIVSGVAFMHQRGIAHCDLKPGNILVDQPDLKKAICLVSDFGLSRVCRKKDESIVKSSNAAGTRPYMTPEILRIHDYGGDYDPFLADSWACGVIIFRLVNRDYPFEDTAGMLEMQLAHKIKFGPRKQFEPCAKLNEMVHHLLDLAAETRMTVISLARHSWYAAEMAQVEETVPKVKNAKSPNEGVQEQSASSSTTASSPSTTLQIPEVAKPSPSTSSRAAPPAVAKPETTPNKASSVMPKATSNAAKPSAPSPAQENSTKSMGKPAENAKKAEAKDK